MPSGREALKALHDTHVALQKAAGKWFPTPTDLATRATYSGAGKVRRGIARGAYHLVANTGPALAVAAVPALIGYGMYKTLKGAKQGSQQAQPVDQGTGQGVY